jgi:hypothetical protein
MLAAAKGTVAPYYSFRGRDFDDFAFFVATKGTKGLYYSFRGKEMRCGGDGVQFRRWATEHLSEYLVKGFTMDDERLQTHAGRKPYIDITESTKKDAIKKMEEAFKKK